jgi:putative ATP-dependent endonuclease of OLD family
MSSMTNTAIIRKLTIDCFRGIKRFEWFPAPSINIILGGGDIGKSTILEAIALLLNPSSGVTVAESDYWQGDNTKEFTIEAVISLPGSSTISNQKSFSWPWAWDGKDATQPMAPTDGSGDDLPAPDDPVYRVRVRGTTGLDLAWEIIQPDAQVDHFSIAVRRDIGLVRLGGDDRNDRDLRLVYGSALDRLLSDTALRARIGKQVSTLDLHASLNDKGMEAIKKLDKKMSSASLPSDLKLGLTTSQGLSIGALIGLLAGKNGVSLPLASWGAGTRRMAAMEIASSIDKEASVTIIDEIERGLEPYRLRKLINILHNSVGQKFITTHSPVAIACAGRANLWYLDVACNIGALPYEKIQKQQEHDPETFLSKVAVIAEGATEVGFLSFLLTKSFTVDPLDCGVRVCDGHGNPAVLDLLETLSSAGLVFAGLVDDEGADSGRWRALKDKLGDRLHQWPNGCTEQNVIGAVPEAKLWDLLKDSAGELSGYRLRTLADRLGIADKEIPAIEQALQRQGKTLRQLITEAATGSTAGAPVGKDKEWKSHSRCWFKSEGGGRELAQKMAETGAWSTVSLSILPLLNAILDAAGQAKLERLSL